MDFWDWLTQRGGLITGDADAYRPGGSEFNKAGIAHALRTAIRNLETASAPGAALDFYNRLKTAGGLVASDDPRVWARGQGGDIEGLITAATTRFLANTASPGDPTSRPFKGRTLNNVPGKPEVWKMGGGIYLAYIVPGTEADPVYMLWAAPAMSDVQSWFGPGKPVVFDRTITTAQGKAMGVMTFGTTDEIPPGDKNPFAGWATTLKVEAQSQPWIMDDDYQRLMAMALVEGRSLTDAEIATTKWWKTHSAAERRWMITYHGDPETAASQIEDGRLQIRNMIQEAGGGTRVGAGVINYMTNEWVQGRWTLNYLNSQIRALTDPFSGIALDPGLAKQKTGTVGSTTEGEDVVRQLLSTWLGPAFGNWDQKEISRQAGLIRNDPDAQRALEERLKTQRLALFPEYTDREMSYAAIANTWKQWWLGQWGEMPDEKESLFIDVLKRNDITESAKILRKEGLARGIEKVTQDLSRAGQSLGGSERNPIVAR